MSADHKSILITGCSSGIGLSVALALDKLNYQVIASARKAADVKRLQSLGLNAVLLDLDDSNSIQQGLKQTLDITGGGLYALFNNGAYGQAGALEDLSREALRAQFETNVFGWHELTRLVIPIMRKKGHGRIIQNSSVLGLVAMPYRGAYNASKFAIEGYSDTLRQELRATNIKVALIEPGPILSKFRQNSYAAFKRHINPEHSPHRDAYTQMQARLEKPGAAAPFTLPAEAVIKPVLHALQSRRPKLRYPVTFPTYLFGFLRRILPARVLDWLLLKV